jgi:poly[(R)-3-hydroxyalkanoate] polymerase subunit PhaC
MALRKDRDKYLAPEAWQAQAARHDGSWWPAWESWLARASARRSAPPPMGAAKSGYVPLADAPGTYVLTP